MGIALLIMSEHAKLQELCGKSYKQQAVWFLNCFWEQFAEKEAELFWNYVQKNAELDLENHEQGAALDEMKAHVFLEKFDETLTVRAMREKLRSTGALGETERPKVVPLTHYLLYKYNADWKLLVDETRQGSNKEEMEKAEAMLREVQAAFADAQQKAPTAKKAFLEAQSAEASAKSAESAAVARDTSAKASAETAKTREIQAQKDAEAAKAREAEAKQAQQELEAALAEVKAQEDAYNQKKAELERKSTEGGVVSQNKAKAELAQHLAEDPLPLRRAKITQEAAVKKAERATKAAAEARTAAEQSAIASSEARKAAEADAAAAAQARAEATRAREAAEAAARASEQAKAAADAALDAAAQRLQEAEDYLAEVKSRPGQAFGQLWWIDRELHEAKKYLPTARGGIAK